MSGRGARYGIDIPNLVASSLGVGGASIALAAAFYDYSGLPFAVRAGLLAAGTLVGLRFVLVGATYIIAASTTKLRDRDRLFRDIEWQGVGSVLDAGCGPGLLLVGSAKMAPGARAVGVDVWHSDLESGNTRHRALENASVEGVGDRVEVRDGDIRGLPFPDSSFDLVLSRAVLNHMKSAEDRAKAIHELARVLRPGGQLGLVIVDFWRIGEYSSRLQEEGVGVRIVRPVARYPPGLNFLMGLTGLTTLVGVKGPEQPGRFTPGGSPP